MKGGGGRRGRGGGGASLTGRGSGSTCVGGVGGLKVWSRRVGEELFRNVLGTASQ